MKEAKHDDIYNAGCLKKMHSEHHAQYKELFVKLANANSNNFDKLVKGHKICPMCAGYLAVLVTVYKMRDERCAPSAVMEVVMAAVAEVYEEVKITEQDVPHKGETIH